MPSLHFNRYEPSTSSWRKPTRRSSPTSSQRSSPASAAGATLGVAVLGAVFALAGGDADGLRAALVAGALAPLAGAVMAITAIPRPQKSP